jgi:hypothetical protein
MGNSELQRVKAREMCIARNKPKHGKFGTPIYNVWAQMIARCTNPNSTSWHRYGGRGISVCDDWRKSFEVFYADMGDPPIGLSLDRRNNDEGYSKANCRWATKQEQAMNRCPRKRDSLGRFI